MTRFLGLAIVLLFYMSVAHADHTINQLGAGSALTGTEQIPMFQSGNPATDTTPAAIATFVKSSTPSLALIASNFGAVCDGGSHPLSGFYANLGAAQAVYSFVTSLSQQIDYAALQKMSNTALGPPGSEHGSTNAYLNTPMFIQGNCNLGNDTWLILNASGINISGAAKTAATLTGNNVVLGFDGLWYSQISNLSIITAGGIAALDVDGNTGLTYTTRSVQGNTFQNLLVINNGSTACTVNGAGVGQSGSCYAVANCRVGQSGAQCSENTWINLHTQGGQRAGYVQIGSNALDNQLIGGDIQSFPKNGVELLGGSIAILKTSFEGVAGYNQIVNAGCDVQASASGDESSINVIGVRSQDLCVYNGGFSQWADIRGVSQAVAGYVNWAAATHFALNTITKQHDANGFAYLFLVTTAGTTGSSPPVWPTGGGTVTDGSVVWTQTNYNAVSIAEGTFDIRNSHLDTAAGWLTGVGVSSITSCGGGTPSTLPNSNRWSGTVTEGTTATGCTINFGSSFWFNPRPQCIVTGVNNGPPTGYSVNATTYQSLTITNASASGNAYTWECWQ